MWDILKSEHVKKKVSSNTKMDEIFCNDNVLNFHHFYPPKKKIHHCYKYFVY